jgi:hypothetical protein
MAEEHGDEGLVEEITHDGECLAYVIRAAYAPGQTTFVTPDERVQQIGFIVYPAGGRVQAHTHRPIERHIVGTGEVILVRSGRCHVDIFTDERGLVASRELAAGDVVAMVSGGHGFRIVEPTVLLEVKQGPYEEADEKDRFEP